MDLALPLGSDELLVPNELKQLFTSGCESNNLFLTSNDVKDLEKAIDAFSQVIAALTEEDGLRADTLRQMGLSYVKKYEISRQVSDLRHGLDLYEKGIDTMEVNFALQADYQSRLAMLHRFAFSETADSLNLERAKHFGERAVGNGSSRPVDQAQYLTNLSRIFDTSYQKTGNLEELNHARELSVKAVDLRPSTSTAFFEEHLTQLGFVTLGRYMATGAIADLGRSIQIYESAYFNYPSFRPEWPELQMNLSLAYRLRFQRTHTPGDLEQCEMLSRRVIELKSDPVYQGKAWQQLALISMDQYERVKAISSLEAIEHVDTAIQNFREALRVTPPSIAARQSEYLSNLGVAYIARYKMTGAAEDLDQAADTYQKAIQIKPESERDNSLSAGLATVFELRSGQGSNADDIQQALDLLSVTLENSSVPLQSRVEAGMRMMYLKASTGKWDEANRVSNSILGLIPLLTPRFLGVADKQQLLRSLTSFASDAAAVALMADQSAFEALSIIELGRGVILGSLIDLRSDISELHEKYPDLAGKFIELRDRIDAPIPSTQAYFIELQRARQKIRELSQRVREMPGWETFMNSAAEDEELTPTEWELRMDVDDLAEDYPDLASEFYELMDLIDEPMPSIEDKMSQRNSSSEEIERLIREIRGMPGMGRFLLAPAETEIASAAKEGAIVVINISQYRCDAFVINDGQIGVVPLPGAGLLDVQDLAKRPLDDECVLEWLWTTIALPVLDSLGIIQSTGSSWPRIWWIPTGPLASFPIHAAGFHRDTPGMSVLDRAISSYSVSVRAIIHNRQYRARHKANQKPHKATLVSMPKTPGHASLGFVDKEMKEVERICSSLRLSVTKPETIRNSVLEALIDCDVFHYAGHGRTDALDPSQSGLLLSDWMKTPLTVGTLLDTNIQQRRPFLAYLSACGTGRVRNEELINEGIHLISAYQLAGFRHVVGTLWEVNDEICAEMAAGVYEVMCAEGMSDISPSQGLHQVCRKLRARWLREMDMRSMGLEREGDISKRLDSKSNQISADVGIEKHGRDAILDEEDQTGPLHWVPYVHYGL
ncbi:unnamed protein product [Clonostachys rhizophaga]|uniref:CHAT domain-containing protein n=1 Tax=Clonostachys rhizophaga TaxID=160324 RepID=A0A9N9YMI1_9HYPO|nr:unnamed protein product [Clonostachys rhizophaga]